MDILVYNKIHLSMFNDVFHDKVFILAKVYVLAKVLHGLFLAKVFHGFFLARVYMGVIEL
jgi:hypothetical protein